MEQRTDSFRRKLEEWQKKLLRQTDIIQPVVTQLMTAAEREVSRVTKTVGKRPVLPSVFPALFRFGRFQVTPGLISLPEESKAAKQQFDLARHGLDLNLFYTDLYSVVPALVTAGAVNTVEDALDSISIPSFITEQELAGVRKDISELIASRDAITGPEVELEEEEEKPEFPELVAPRRGVAAELSIHRLSVQEILKSLTTPRIPETQFSQEEYNEYLREYRGWSQEDIDNQLEIKKDKLIADAKNRKSLIEAFRNQGATVPVLTNMDIAKMVILQPPLAALEALNVYYEHVSMPAAGWLYSKAIPDIQKAYEEFKRENPDASAREAWVYAWKKWEAPGPMVFDFILKYMLMEGLLDPLSYVGWGFVTKGLRTLGPLGKIAARGNMAAAEVLELPFDFAKWVAISVIPKTLSQQAAVISRNSLSVLDAFFEKYTFGGKVVPLSDIKVKDMLRVAEEAIDHFAHNPRADDDIALAARELLVHAPINERDITNWLGRLKAAGVKTFDSSEITDRGLFEIDDLFERVFNKELTAAEAAPLLLQRLGVSTLTEATESINTLATRFLSSKVESVSSRALDFLERRSANSAMRAYARKSLRIQEAILASSRISAEATRAGRFGIFLYDLDRRFLSPWVSQLNRMVIRPAAESYLTFGLYGPLNTVEDIWRSIIGGVKPGRISIERYDIITAGLRGDPNLRTGEKFTEMMGPIKDTGEAARANWILTLGLLPWSVPTYVATRGRITPKKFAQTTYELMVERFGGLGMAIRRNFVGGKYYQLLADMGGDTFKQLYDTVGPLPDALRTTPKWVRRNLVKDLQAAVTTGKLSSDNLQLIKTLKDRYTRNRIIRAEIDDIIKRYPDISPTARSIIMDAFDEKLIFVDVPSVVSTLKERVDRLSQIFPGETVIKFIEVNPSKVDELVTPAMKKVGIGVNAYLDHSTGTLVVRNVEVSDITLLHELAHQWLADYANSGKLAIIKDLAMLAGYEFNDRVVRDAAKLSGITLHEALYREYENVAEELATAIGHKIAGMSEKEMDDIIPGAFILLKRFKAIELPYVPPTTADSIRDFMKTVLDADSDDFLRSPERAAAQSDLLTNFLTSLEVTHPEEMANLIISLHRMSTTYGMMPDQIIARATIKSRGLPIDDRRIQFDAEFDRLYEFLDKAGADIDKVVNKMSQTVKGFEFINNVDWSKVTFINMPDLEMRARIRTAVDKLPFSFKQDIASIEIVPLGRGTKAVWFPKEKRLAFRSADDVTESILNHELAHSYMTREINSGNMEVIGAFADAIGYSRRGEVRLTAIGDISAHYREFKDLHEDFAEVFSLYVTNPTGSARVTRIKEFFETYFPKAQRDLGLPSSYKDAAQYYFDLVTAARQVVTAAKTQDMAFRSSYFSRATQKELRNSAFWEEFYGSEMSHWKDANRKLAAINSQLHQAIDNINREAGARIPPRSGVRVVDRELAPADVAKLMGTRGDDLSRMLLDTIIPEGDRDYFIEYIMSLVRKDVDAGFTPESVGRVYDQIAASIQVDPASSSWFRVRQKQIESMSKDFHDLYNAKLFPDEQKRAVDDYIDSISKNVDGVIGRAGGSFVADYDKIRQSALDEANKWYYKEYTDYTHGNAFDAVMKSIYPFWNYESQRWFWLPRSFMRRPGTLTAWGRWESNTDYGYIHIPGTSIDLNPARGSVYGPWSTRLMRKDFPEYYDNLEGFGGIVQGFDFVSRYGFYPNVIYGALVAQFGGAESQMGGILPSIYSTPLNALIAMFPNSRLVNFISEKVFPEQFRTYLTARKVDDLGGDGSLIFAKKKGGQKLTEEEEAMWAVARRSAATHSAAFEQLGFARMRSDKSYELARASEQWIEEQYGFTPEQQRELRQRGEKLWDIIGGLDPWETAILQELEFFKYSGSINPVLPSRQQEILVRIERDWADVMSYSENQRNEVLLLQQDFLTGSTRGRLGPDDFLSRVRELFGKRRDYIDEKVKANPLMLLENRTEYYEKYGQTMPVQSPYNELMDMYFSIELEDTIDPATGERIYDWDKFWANRDMITDSTPTEDKARWDTFLSRHTAPIMEVWYNVYKTYFKRYYGLWDKVIDSYSPSEKRLIEEYLFLERTQQQLERRQIIKETVSEKDGNLLISSFRSAVSDEREALRYANPHLDAWLFYWGRTTSFKNPKSEQVYRELAKMTGRKID